MCQKQIRTLSGLQLAVLLALWLFDDRQHLPGNGLHATDVGMPVLLADIVQLDDRHAIVLANGVNGVGVVFVEVAVRNEIQACIGIAILHAGKQAGQGRTETELVGKSDVVVFEFAQRNFGPRVVGTSEDEDDVGRAQRVDTGQERPIGGIAVAIAGVADAGARPGIVDAELVAALTDHLPPPRLSDMGYVCALEVGGLVIPGLHGVRREETLISGIGVAENRYGLSTLCVAGQRTEKQGKR